MNEQGMWQLVNPEGVIELKPFRVNPRPRSLEGKTVLLRWSGKPGGDVFLNRIAGLLRDAAKDIRIIKSWEVVPETVLLTSNLELSRKCMRELLVTKPDLVIGAQGD